MANTYDNNTIIVNLMTLKKFASKKELGQAYTDLKTIFEKPYFKEHAYAVYSDLVIHILNLPVEGKDKVNTTHLTTFISNLHLHDIPLSKRNKMVLDTVEYYYNVFYN